MLTLSTLIQASGPKMLASLQLLLGHSGGPHAGDSVRRNPMDKADALRERAQKASSRADPTRQGRDQQPDRGG